MQPYTTTVQSTLLWNNYMYMYKATDTTVEQPYTTMYKATVHPTLLYYRNHTQLL